jgi:hypothetical protein
MGNVVNRALIDAVRAGDERGVEEALCDGASPNATHSDARLHHRTAGNPKLLLFDFLFVLQRCTSLSVLSTMHVRPNHRSNR